MGTFGTGPFDSGGAQDLLNQLADQHPGHRHATVEQLITGVLRQPELLMRQIFPDEIVAATGIGLSSTISRVLS